jgi:predicted nucleotide-binding protein
MNKAVIDRLEKLLDEGDKSSSDREIELWSEKVASFLRSGLGPEEAETFGRLTDYIDSWKQHALRIGHLQGLIARAEATTTAVPAAIISSTPFIAASSQGPSANSRKVFVVHGHDNEAKETTARFLEKLALQPVILHEQPSSGRTIIEKFETYSNDITFAVVLLTPDDLGAAASTSSTGMRPRARQNVIMELGYFIGRLGRVRVCALHKGGVELPSDYQGILYIEMDPAGAWRAKLAQELVQAKLPIELSGLLGG